MTLNELYRELNAKDGQLSGVYKITRKSDGRPYVGQSVCITKRIEEHIKNIRATSDDESKGIDAAIQKEGWENFTYEVLLALPDMTAEQLWRAECIYIDKYDAYNNGFNKTVGNHKNKTFTGNYDGYRKKFIVTKDMMQYIEEILKGYGVTLENRNITLIHSFNEETLNYLKYRHNKVAIINKYCLSLDSSNQYTEDKKELADYIISEVKSMKYNLDDIVIANFPYGSIGASCLKTVVDHMGPDTLFINLEPGNDYFWLNGFGYKHLDTSFNPEVLRNGCFKDAKQVSVISKIQKEENTLSEIEARILLHIDTRGKQDLYSAIKEYLLKVDTIGKVKFTFNGNGKDLIFDGKEFMFNSGGFDIGHGYMAVTTKDRTSWSESTNFNIFGKDTKGNIPHAKIKGRDQFIKLIYSELGLKLLKVLFDASPENWGYTGMFADIDYTGISSIRDLFNKLSLSADCQTALLSAMSEIKLTDKEKDICKIVEAL